MGSLIFAEGEQPLFLSRRGAARCPKTIPPMRMKYSASLQRSRLRVYRTVPPSTILRQLAACKTLGTLQNRLKNGDFALFAQFRCVFVAHLPSTAPDLASSQDCEQIQTHTTESTGRSTHSSRCNFAVAGTTPEKLWNKG